MNHKKDIYKILSIAFILDQIIKLLVMKLIHENQIITVIPNFFFLTFVKNTGAAFSILEGKQLLLIMISVIFIIMINEYLKREENLKTLTVISYGLILGGVFGNLLDRIIHKSVIDFLSFKIFGYSFPIFNFADMCITIGILLLIIDIIREKEKELK